MMKFEIDDEGWANMEVNGTAQLITEHVWTLLAQVMKTFDEDDREVFKFQVVKFLADDNEHEFIKKGDESDDEI